jgi:hypothetical protein
MLGDGDDHDDGGQTPAEAEQRHRRGPGRPPAPIGHHGGNAMLLAFRDRYDAALRVPFPL